MVLKFYGSVVSTCSRCVANVLHEKKIPFEHIEVSLLKGDNKTPEYLEKQPFGQMPYIDDDGFILYESRAICRYLDAKYPDQGPRLVPLDLKAKALFEQAASVELCHFDPYVHDAVGEMIVKPYYGLSPDIVVYEKNIAKLSATIDIYDAILSKQKYLAGDELTLVDLFHVPYGELLAPSGSDLMSKKPNIARWFNELLSRPAWQAVREVGHFESNADM